MRLPRVRFTVRRMMLVVALAAVGAWLIAAAVRVVNDPNGDAIFETSR